MATFRFKDLVPIILPSNIDTIRENQSFLEFLTSQEIGNVRIMDRHRNALWHKMLDQDENEIGKIDGDHDFNYIDLYEPEYYWFIFDLVEKYEAQSPRKVVIDCDFNQSQIPTR